MKKQYPLIPDIRYALVEAYAQQKQLDRALIEMEEWISINPNDDRAKEIIKYIKEQL